MAPTYNSASIRTLVNSAQTLQRTVNLHSYLVFHLPEEMGTKCVDGNFSIYNSPDVQT